MCSGLIASTGGSSEVMGSLAGAAGLVSGPVGWVSTGLQVLGGLKGMFGGSKMSSQNSRAESGTTSVFGDLRFGDSGINNPMVDLSNPIHIGVILAAVGLAVLIYKRVR